MLRRLAPAAALLLVGCVDPEGSFDDFGDRFDETKGTGGSGGGAGSGGGPGDGGSCMPPAAGEMDGQFFFALSAVISPKKPISFLADVTTADDAGATTMTLTLQPLRADDRTTPIGSPIPLDPIPLGADGAYSSALPPLMVDGDANPITPGTAIEATVTLSGQVCGVEDFYCGSVGGMVSSPIELGLDGSTFTLERVAMGGSLPAPPKINCAGDLAGDL